MMAPLKCFASAVAAVVLICASSVWSIAAEELGEIGTLTCVASPGEKELLGPERELSCTFEPLNGAKVELKGVVKQVGTNTAPGTGKIVMVWSVLGPQKDGPPSQLEGRYIGALGESKIGAGSPGLVGGASGNLTLRPLTPAPETGENIALAVIELQLVAMKA